MIHPVFECAEFHPRTCSYALIIGVFNEGEKFTQQLISLQSFRSKVDIIIADGGSDDGATSSQLLQNKTRTLLINKDSQRGLSVQYRIALHYALNQGYEGVIMMDGNGKDGVEAIDAFIAKLKAGYDFIQGSRFLPGGHHENTPIDRVLGIRLVFNPIINLASGYHYTDGMNGFKACSRTFISDSRIQLFRSIFVRYNLQYYCNYSAPKIGFRVCEIPVSRRYTTSHLPQSKIIGLRARLKIIWELLNTITGRYNPL
jgi:dolichol-phosphate mannosyltransferase